MNKNISPSKKLFGRKELLKLIFPLMVELALTLLVGMIDSVMVSSVGEAAIFRTMGNSKITMYLSAMMNLINICGNAFFIYFLKYGTAGAAAATVVSMWIFRIGAAYLFAGTFGIGALGVWLAMVCDWLFRTVVFVIRWLSGKWKAYRVVYCKGKLAENIQISWDK